MKIIVCPSCNEQVSNLTVKCPHCGNIITGTYDPKYTTKPKSGLFSTLLWIVVFLGILGGAYYYYYGR